MALRLVFIACVVLPFTLVFLPVQIAILALKLPIWPALPLVFFKLLAFALGLKITLHGALSRSGPVLLVSNHIGWLDIVAIASQMPVSFVARADIAGWPLIGVMARLQRTILVDRTRRTDAGRTAREMSARLEQGVPVMLFAEGTSSTGTHVLPFRSALLGAAVGQGGDQNPAIQPVAIAYTAISSLPIARAERRQVAWIGDMGVFDNFGTILSSGPKTVHIAFGMPLDGTGSRKAVAKQAEDQVRQMLNSLNRGYPLPGAA